MTPNEPHDVDETAGDEGIDDQAGEHIARPDDGAELEQVDDDDEAG
jgi:hypothetical protein